MLTRLRVSALSVSLVLSALVGCGGGSSSSASPSAQPSQVSIAITPEQTLQTVLKPQTFRAAVKGATDQAVTWSVVSGGGSIDATTGLYLAGPVPGPAIVKATSVAHPSVSATQAVTLVAAPTIGGFTTDLALIPYGGSANLTPTFITDGTAVVSPSISGGAITSGSVYPVSPTAITSYTLTVTNSAGTSVAAAVTVNVQTAQVSIAPAAVTLTASTQQKFSAIVGGAVNTGVTWSVTGGAVNGTGTYTAPATPGDYAVVATSSADPSKSVLAAVHVVAAPNISVLTASQWTISQGHGTILNYTFSGGTGVIDQGVGTVVSTGTSNVAPSSTEKYTLTVTNAAGASVSSWATITVVPPPVADISFGAGVPAGGSVLSETSGLTASVPAQDGCTYAWTASGSHGNITAGATTSTATFQTLVGDGSLPISCTVTNAAGDSATSTVPLYVQRHWRSMQSGPATPFPLPDGMVVLKMAVDDNSTLWMAWNGVNASGTTYGIYAAKRLSYGSGGTAVRLDTTSISSASALGSASIASDNHGHAMAVWKQDTGTGPQVWSSHYNGSAWGSPVRVDAGGTTDGATNPAVGMDGAGNAVAIWDEAPIASPTSYKLMASRFNGSAWQTPAQIDGTGGSSTYCVAGDHSLSVDASGGALVGFMLAYGDGEFPGYAAFNGSSWASNSFVGAGSHIATAFGSGHSVLAAANGSGFGMLAFTAESSGNLAVYTQVMSLNATSSSEGPVLALIGSGSKQPFLTSLNYLGTGAATLAGGWQDGTLFVAQRALPIEIWTTLTDPSPSSPSGPHNYAASAGTTGTGTIPMFWLNNDSGQVLATSFDGGLGAWTPLTALTPGTGYNYWYLASAVSPNHSVTVFGGLFSDANGEHIFTDEFR
ncbi:MAG TPA: hypothetical protein VL181_02915 [Holophagaceae bacterium]|nr:hypothetical protein [Holophagaceae bacterium]